MRPMVYITLVILLLVAGSVLGMGTQTDAVSAQVPSATPIAVLQIATYTPSPTATTGGLQIATYTPSPTATTGGLRVATHTPTPTTPAAAPAAAEPCTVSSSYAINKRSGPGTAYNVVGALQANESAEVVGQARGADRFTWWKIERAWVREDVVTAKGNCDDVPQVGAPPPPPPGAQAPAQPSPTPTTRVPPTRPPTQPPTPPPAPTMFPSGEVIIHYPVYQCHPTGLDRFSWYEVEEIFFNGVSQGIRVLGGPFSGPWQENCPVITCGDNKCEWFEDEINCPQDCNPTPPPPPPQPVQPTLTPTFPYPMGCKYNSANDCCNDTCGGNAACINACVNGAAPNPASSIQHPNGCWGCWCPTGFAGVCP